MKRDKFLQIVCFICFATGIFLSGFGTREIMLNRELYNGVSIEMDDCDDVNDLFNYTKCLNNNLSSWFVYNISNIKLDLNDDQFMNEGGVCWHSARWYDKRIRAEGYYSKIVRIDVNETFEHEFEIASGEDGYCILDQKTVECFNFDLNSTGVENES